MYVGTASSIQDERTKSLSLSGLFWFFEAAFYGLARVHSGQACAFQGGEIGSDRCQGNQQGRMCADASELNLCSAEKAKKKKRSLKTAKIGGKKSRKRGKGKASIHDFIEKEREGSSSEDSWRRRG